MCVVLRIPRNLFLCCLHEMKRVLVCLDYLREKRIKIVDEKLLDQFIYACIYHVGICDQPGLTC